MSQLPFEEVSRPKSLSYIRFSAWATSETPVLSKPRGDSRCLTDRIEAKFQFDGASMSIVCLLGVPKRECERLFMQSRAQALRRPPLIGGCLINCLTPRRENRSDPKPARNGSAAALAYQSSKAKLGTPLPIRHSFAPFPFSQGKSPSEAPGRRPARLGVLGCPPNPRGVRAALTPPRPPVAPFGGA